jgi:hypothetical protein
MFDTAVVNGLCEVPSSIGGALAGSYANSMASQYLDEIVEDIKVVSLLSNADKRKTILISFALQISFL